MKGREKPWLPCMAPDKWCIIAGMLTACLSICGSDGEVFTWLACVGVAVVRGFIRARLCVCAEATGDDVHSLFP